MKRRLLSLVLCLLAAPALADTGRVHALLIGVGDYLYLDADLKGPPQDVTLMAETLIARGVDPQAIVALGAQRLPAGTTGGAATRSSILAQMDTLAAHVQPGDTVVFYFSGHGAQAPDTSGDEGGGYDEILLPADAKAWRGAIGMVENALLDDELSEWARGILARGVRLVGIIDACHSATGFRAMGGAGVARTLDAAALGLPDDAPSASGLPASADTDALEGDFVFLYSSQSDQRSFEYPYGDGSVWHGEFTLRLADVLTHAPEASWAQVLGAATEAMQQGPARQQPEGEGPLLAAKVFGTGLAEARLAVTQGGLDAGFLHGLAVGAEVALYAQAAGGAPLGSAIVTGVEARRALLSDAPAEARFAEIIAAPPPPPLRLAAPVVADDADYSLWLAALPPAAPGSADLVPVLTGGQVALTRADGVLDPEGPGSTPRIRPDPGETEAEATARVLDQAAHALRLRSTLAGGPAQARRLTAQPVLEVRADRRPGLSSGQTCGTPGALQPLAEGQALGDCDQVFLTVTNTSGKDQDITILYLAADFTISAIWPTRQLVNRLAAGETLRSGLQITPGTAPAQEEVWVIAVPAEPAAPRNDLTVLATPETTRSLGAAAGPAAQWLSSRLTDDAEAARTRGFSLKPPAFTLIRKQLPIALSPPN
ncbi:MAG: caspase family protein [Cypionkella sp.]|jgi:uncharacterized caspase-like protein|nr:caspase family protein [Cypionkella sp.]